MKWNRLYVVLILLIFLVGCGSSPAVEHNNSYSEEANMTLTEVLNSLGSFNNAPQEQIDKVVAGTKRAILDSYSKEDTALDLKSGKFKVMEVFDGDTLYIEVAGKREAVRLLCIDTPEIKEEDPLAEEARDYLKNLVKGEEVEIYFGIGKDGTGRDPYDRLLGYVFHNGSNINGMIIAHGYARVAYVFEPDTQYAKEFYQIEREARESKIGIWGIKGYVSSKGFNR